MRKTDEEFEKIKREVVGISAGWGRITEGFAIMNTSRNAKVYAERQGLYLFSLGEDIMMLANSKDFKPKVYRYKEYYKKFNETVRITQNPQNLSFKKISKKFKKLKKS